MEMSNKTAREIWAEVKANPNRARFGYGKKAVLVVEERQPSSAVNWSPPPAAAPPPGRTRPSS